METPILDMTLSTPLPSALMRFISARFGVMACPEAPTSSPVAARSRTVSIAR